MKKILSIILLAGLSLSANGQQVRHKQHVRVHSANKRAEQQVYICNGPYARKWHRSSSCAGGNCRSTTSRISLSEAQMRMDGPCGRCW